MIAWWSVTLASLTTRPSGSTSSPVTYAAARAYSRWRADDRSRRLQVADHVARQEARAGARIRQRLVVLVQALRRRQRAPRREPVARVGLALQRGQVVQERRTLLLGRRLELGDLARPVADRVDDRRRLLGGLQPRLRAGVVAAVVAPPALAGRSARTWRRPASTAPARTRGSPPRGGRGSPASASARGRATRRRRTTTAAGWSPRAWSSCRRSSRPPSATAPPPRAARSSEAGRSVANACLIAAAVIDDSHSRCTGLRDFAFSYVQAKISSPSRPASHALMTRSTSSRRSSLEITLNCFFERSSRTTRRNSSGTIGRSAIFHFLYLGSYSSGSASWTRCPTAQRDDVRVGLQIALVLLERARERPRQIAADGRLLGDDQRLAHGFAQGSSAAARARRDRPALAPRPARRARSRSARRSRRAAGSWSPRRSSSRPGRRRRPSARPSSPAARCRAARRSSAAPGPRPYASWLTTSRVWPSRPARTSYGAVQREAEDRRRRTGLGIALELERRRVEPRDAQHGEVVARVERDRLRFQPGLPALGQHARVVLAGDDVGVGDHDAGLGHPARALDADAARRAEDLDHARACGAHLAVGGDPRLRRRHARRRAVDPRERVERAQRVEQRPGRRAAPR